MQTISPPDMPAVAPGYAHGVAAAGLIFVSGQLPVDAHGEVVGAGDVGQQTHQVLQNVARVLGEQGLGLRDVVAVTAYLTDLSDYNGYVQAYQQEFGDHTPARATVQANLVRPEFLVEIQAIAVDPKLDS